MSEAAAALDPAKTRGAPGPQWRPAPRVWVLLGEGAGGNAQMLTLAAALGWPFEAKQMRYNRLNHLPNPLLGATATTLGRASRATLARPWPDLVIAASRRAAPVARWIKRRSRGHTKLVHLLHTQAPLHHFDLVVTLAQYRLPERANVLHNTLPLNTPDAADLQRAARYWRPAWADLPRPWIAVLVGGNSSSYRLCPATAARLGRRASAAAAGAGGSVLVTTSRRTPADAADALFDAISVPAYCYRWRAGDDDNPYTGFLALADRFIVTADSASLPAEACASGRPVTLFDWAAKSGGRFGRLRMLPRALGDRAHAALVYRGWLKPRRDFAAFHAGLAAHGLIDREPPAAPPDDLGATVERIQSLMADTAARPARG